MERTVLGDGAYIFVATAVRRLMEAHSLKHAGSLSSHENAQQPTGPSSSQVSSPRLSHPQVSSRHANENAHYYRPQQLKDDSSIHLSLRFEVWLFCRSPVLDSGKMTTELDLLNATFSKRDNYRSTCSSSPNAREI